MTEIRLTGVQAANYIIDELHKDKPFNLVLDQRQANVFFWAVEEFQGDLRLSVSYKSGITTVQVNEENADAIYHALSSYIAKFDRYGVVQSLKEVS